jgi:hypothetical protein
MTHGDPEMGPKYFVPVCLYPHTKYRTVEGVSALFDKFQFCVNEYLIVVADRLLALDNLVTGRYWSYSSVFEKAKKEAIQVKSLIKRVSVKKNARNSGRIVLWDEIADTADFGDFAGRMRQEVLSEELLSNALEDFVSRRVARFGLGSAPEKERDAERN